MLVVALAIILNMKLHVPKILMPFHKKRAVLLEILQREPEKTLPNIALSLE